MDRSAKQAQIDALVSDFGGTSHAFLIDFRGLKVPDVTELRAKIRSTGSSYAVVKNTLAKRAIKDTPLEKLAADFAGPTALAWNTKDPVALAKVLADFAKNNPNVRFKKAMVDGAVVEGSQVAAVAAMPSREELVAKLLFVLQSPMRNLVTVLSAPPRGLVNAMSQVAKEKEKAGA